MPGEDKSILQVGKLRPSGAPALGSLAVTLISGDSGALVLGSSWSLLPEGMELEYSPSTSSRSLSSGYWNDRGQDAEWQELPGRPPKLANCRVEGPGHLHHTLPQFPCGVLLLQLSF